MSWHYLQGLEEVSSEAICWGGERFAPSNGLTTLAGYCLPDSETESCHDSQSGMTCRHSMGILGEAESMSSQVDSLVKTSAQPEKAQESQESEAGCGQKWRGSLGKYDPSTHSLKIAQCSLLEDSMLYSATLPRWGTMRNGELFQQPTAVLNTCVKESGYLHTPTATANQLAPSMVNRSKYFPTPTADMAKETNSPSESLRNTPSFCAMFGGKLNPDWVELLMGWPTGWTRLTNINEIKNDLTQWNDNWEMDIPRTTQENNGRANRLKCIGNGQVPICAATAFKILFARINHA